MAAADIKNACASAPFKVLLIVCIVLSVIGWITVEAETEDGADSLWWRCLVAAVIPALLLAGLFKEAHADKFLTIALGFVWIAVPDLFTNANVADEADLSDLAFGYTMCILGASVGWLAYAPNPKEVLGVLKAAIVPTVLFVIGLLSAIILWIESEALDLSVHVFVGATTFIMATAVAADKELLGWLATFFAAVCFTEGMGHVLDSDGGVMFAGLLALVFGIGALFWLYAKSLGGGDKPDPKGAIGSMSGKILLVFLVLAIVGCIMASDADQGDDSDSYNWFLTRLFFIPLLVLLGTLVSGGSTTVLVVWAAAWFWQDGFLQAVSYSVRHYSAKKAAEDVEGVDYDETTTELGLAILEIIALASFLAPRWVQPEMGAIKEMKPSADIKAPWPAFLLLILGWLFSVFDYMDEESHQFVYGWAAFAVAFWYVACVAGSAPANLHWLLLFWASALFHLFFTALLDDDEGGLRVLSYLLEWIGVLVLMIHAFFKLGGGGGGGVAPAGGEAA